MAKIIIFGTGDIAQIANYYFEKDSEHEVVAFTLNREYITQNRFENKPVVPFEEIQALYPPGKYSFFLALSYGRMNKLRAEKFAAVKNAGYSIVSYVSSKCTYLSQHPCGENCFIFEDNTIQPYVKIGNNVTIWSGNHIGHHSTIEDHNFVSSHVVISGHCCIKSYCFLGVNSTIGHQVVLAPETLVGAGAIIVKNTVEKGVYVPAKSVLLEKKSDEFKL
jgi:sugar O-acyltransferase (sialic acid O-acetyltransferase NeuD family)